MINIFTQINPSERVHDISIGRCSKSISYVYAITDFYTLDIKTFNSSPFTRKTLEWMNKICDYTSYKAPNWKKSVSFKNDKFTFNGDCFPSSYSPENEQYCVLRFELSNLMWEYIGIKD